MKPNPKVYQVKNGSRLAVMGGAYGNLSALQACIDHARSHACETLAFIGDATGCFGHSDETLKLIRQNFCIFVAGNHEQQAAAGLEQCGCNYASIEDERYGCIAHQYAMHSLSEENRKWVGTWPDLAVVEIADTRVLLCHGSPELTNEFLYESVLNDRRLRAWINEFRVSGFVCTHSGIPWIRQVGNGLFAANCGVVGKPDHDGDSAVHYAILEPPLQAQDAFAIELERVEYDHQTWAEQMDREGVDEVFISPLRTGVWTCGVKSLPPIEQAPRPRFTARMQQLPGLPQISLREDKGAAGRF